MDHYQLIAASLPDSPVQTTKIPCRGRQRKHVNAILDSAYPPIDPRSDTLFEDIEKRGDRMFFSQERLANHFRKPGVIKDLLSCSCECCRESQGLGLDGLDIEPVLKQDSPRAWLYLPVLIYLGKLHFVYTWIKRGMHDSPRSVLHNMRVDEPLLRSLFGDDTTEGKLFWRAYDLTIDMFKPTVFKISENRPFPRPDLGHNTRFPFWHEEVSVRQGSFGHMTKFEVVDEYLDDSIRNLMSEYPTSVEGKGHEKKLKFARKSLNLERQDFRNEQDVLQMVRMIQKPASDNIITLVMMYNWRQHVHFIFPYVSNDLYYLLRSNNLALGDEPLLQNSIWKEMVGVSSALYAFHDRMPNPFPGDKDKVIAFHFDLKPANILVTEDGKLKIADFGHSTVMHVNDDEGDQDYETPFVPGDPKYAAPESQPAGNVSQGSPGSRITASRNYDVWSLACIMIEVLTRLLASSDDGPSVLANLHAALDEGDNPTKGRFYSSTGHVQECVKEKLDKFGETVPARTEIQREIRYTKDVVALLKEMFHPDKRSRISSKQVVARLKDAEDCYRSTNPEAVTLASEVRDHRLENGAGFKELGWSLEGENMSFVKMDGITLELVT